MILINSWFWQIFIWPFGSWNGLGSRIFSFFKNVSKVPYAIGIYRQIPATDRKMKYTLLLLFSCCEKNIGTKVFLSTGSQTHVQYKDVADFCSIKMAPFFF